MAHKINCHGNNFKSMHISVEAGLKKLLTSHIDIPYVHVWDFETSVEGAMSLWIILLYPERFFISWLAFLWQLSCLLHGLFVLRVSPILLLEWFPKLTNTPAITQRHHSTFMKDAGMSWTDLWSANPMTWEHGMALAPWDVLAGGKLRSDAEEERCEKSGENRRDQRGRVEVHRTREEDVKCPGESVKGDWVESITAGSYTLTSLHPSGACWLLDTFSRDRACDAIKDVLNLPSHRWTEGWTSHANHRGSQPFPQLRSNVWKVSYPLKPAQYNRTLLPNLTSYEPTKKLCRVMGPNRMACLLW